MQTLNVTELDFDAIKQNLISFIRGQELANDGGTKEIRHKTLVFEVGA